MEFGQIVYLTSGRDKGRYFLVVDIDEKYIYICDGKLRCVERPKKKKMKHVKATKMFDLKLSEKLKNNESISNSEVRKYLSYFKLNPSILECKEVY